MKNTPTFSVVVTGEVRDGCDVATVTEKFAGLFKLPSGKASSLLARRRVLKKEIDGETAEKYRRKLEGIGLVVELEKHDPPADSFSGLALEPIEEPEPEPEPDQGPGSGSESCPKCGHEQPVSASQCEACGFQLHQMAGAPAAAPAAAMEAPAMAPAQEAVSASHAGGLLMAGTDHEPASPVIETGDSLAPMAIGAAAGAAFLGALLWKVIAMTTGYEVGYVAWGIGGVIGIAASVTGARGMASGVVCAGLALMAILGGKYMVVSELMDQMTGEMASEESQQEWREVYEEDLADAGVYAEQVYDGETLRQFMVERGYSMAYESGAVTDEEIRVFEDDHEPRLKRIAYGETPSFREWYDENISTEIENVSKAGIVTGNLDLLDALFLFLGIGTAFRLGQGVDFS